MGLHAERVQKETGVLAVKFAIAALVFNETGDVMVCHHAPRDGESADGAAGSVTETLRYLKENKQLTETPLEALARCLEEEHNIRRGSTSEAGLHMVDDAYPFLGEWNVGWLGGIKSTYIATNLILRTTNPDAFLSSISEEINYNEFMPVENALKVEPHRPGYREWLRKVSQEYPADVLARSPMTEINWPRPVQTANDVRHPYQMVV